MNKEKALMQLKDLLFNFENFEEVETTEDDVQALEYAIKELERTAQEIPVQEQLKFIPEDSNGICIDTTKNDVINLKLLHMKGANDMEKMNVIDKILREAESDETVRGTRIVAKMVGYIEATDKNFELNSDEAYKKVLQLTKLIREVNIYDALQE